MTPSAMSMQNGIETVAGVKSLGVRRKFMAVSICAGSCVAADEMKIMGEFPHVNA
jgi:hypothetical protein